MPRIARLIVKGDPAVCHVISYNRFAILYRVRLTDSRKQIPILEVPAIRKEFLG